MGNCFGKPKSDNFSGGSGGQTLGNSTTSNPAPKPVITSNTKPKAAASYAPTPAQGRVVGGSSPAQSSSDPRVAAAMAAEERLKASQSKDKKGKLGKQLDAQKSQSHNRVLDETSRETRLARDADANAEVRNWN